MTYHIRYARVFPGLFIVTLPALSQRIAVAAPVMSRIVGTPPNAVLGSWTINAVQAARLGFLPTGHHPQVNAAEPEVIAHVGA